MYTFVTVIAQMLGLEACVSESVVKLRELKGMLAAEADRLQACERRVRQLAEEQLSALDLGAHAHTRPPPATGHGRHDTHSESRQVLQGVGWAVASSASAVGALATSGAERARGTQHTSDLESLLDELAPAPDDAAFVRD